MIHDLNAIRVVEGTKVSHDYSGSNIQLFSYRELFERRTPAVGIPCKQNGLIIIDVDVEGPTHKKDGREFWRRFCVENNIPSTYAVRTPSGGYHFYFFLPESVNPETFSPPGELAPGVDLKWNGWAGAPPTAGYSIHYGSLQDIQVAPPALMNYISELIQGKGSKTFDIMKPNDITTMHQPFSPSQIHELVTKLEWMQVNATLSRAEWRDGLFALKAGIDDPVLLDELTCKWTMNKAYSPGDEDQAREIVARADKYGTVGPGTILAIIRMVQIREGAPMVETKFTIAEIFDRAKIPLEFDKKSKIMIESTESNAGALLGASFDEDELYHDIRQDLYIYKGKSYSDTQLVNMFIPILQSPAFGLGLEKFRKNQISSGLDVLMSSRQKDPHIEYLKGLKWDGVRRIGKFFTTYAGVPSSPYSDLVGTNFWSSLAARGLEPGCKFDSMVVLEGREGINKSSFVEAIGGEYTYAPDEKDSLSDKDALRQMHQAAVVELPELIGLVGESALKVKAFLAKPYDNCRDLYARKAMKNPRGFVFIGTTNDDKYLTLALGARRFWPIKIPHDQQVNISALRSDRDQLFAEGIQMYRDGHPYWLMPKTLLDPEIESRVIEEPLMGPIKTNLLSMGPAVSTSDIYRSLESAGYVTRGLTHLVVTRIEDSLRRLGCHRDVNGMWQNNHSSVMQSFIQAMAPQSYEAYV